MVITKNEDQDAKEEINRICETRIFCANNLFNFYLK
jgi:hypothetical protein